ncbi:MAG: ACT domain-containing protein [Acutalibacteraceae bacterium]
MVQQLSVFLENRAGELSEITNILYENDIDIRALFIAETTDYGVLRLIVSDTEKAKKALSEKEIITSQVAVTAVSVPDQPGGLGKLLKLLAEKNIDISYMYSVFGQADGQAHMIFRVHDTDTLEETLRENGIKTETIEDLK